MAAVAVSSVNSGQSSARIRGAARDIFATMRRARSTALVTGQPCVISYSTAIEDGETCAKIEIDGAKLFGKNNITTAETLSGETVRLDANEDPADGETAQGGETVEDILFSPISEDVVRGIAIKVVKEGEDLDYTESAPERKKSMISSYSNIDALLGRYKEESAKKESADGEKDGDGAGPDDQGPAAGQEVQEKTSFVWETNGRTEAHKVYVYIAGRKPDSGYVIKTDMFGAMKIVSADEEDD